MTGPAMREPAANMVEIRLLGPVLLLASDQVLDVGPPQRCAVLAALAVDAGRLVTTETLIDRVWGGSPSAKARRTLHAHIARLRRLLEQAARQSRTTARISSRSGGYLLELGGGRVDILQLRELLTHAEAVGHDQRQRAATLRTALLLWRGDPLADLTGPWAARTRRAWRRLHVQATLSWARTELELGRADTVIEPISDLIHDNPFDEQLAATLMQALQRIGNQAAALQVFAAARARLVDELGAEPGPLLRRVQQQVLRGDREDAAGPAGRIEAAAGNRPRRVVGWPYQVGALPPRADGFQQRAVARELERAAASPAASTAVRVLSGLGGVGKTQLAAELARTLWAGRHLDLLIWVPAVSRDAVISSYAQACGDLGLGPDDEAPEAAAARLLAWFAGTERRWLVVLDDVARPADVHDLWPPQHPTGHTVVTTRRRDATLVGGRQLIDIGVFQPAEATEFLTRKLPARLGDDIGGVVADLGSLPVALSHAATYMVDQDLTCGAYRSRFDDRRRRLEQLFPDQDGLFDGTARTVATTWTISMDAADALRPAGLARPLLEIASMLDPNGIPDTVFVTAACRRDLSERLGRTPDAAEVRDGLRCLHRFHLITHQDGLVRVHALVQRAVRESLAEPAAADIVRTAADALLESWPTLDEHAGRLLRANSAALRRHGESTLWQPERGAHPVLARTVDSLGAAAQLSEAIALCRDLADVSIAQLGRDHPDTFLLLNQLSIWLGDAGLLAEALAQLEKLAPGAAAVLGPDHLISLDIRHNLGYQRGMAGDPRSAVAELAAVVADRVRVLGPDHPTVMGCRNQLAFWRSNAGDHHQARTELEQLLPQAVRILGADHHDTLEIRGNLAQCRGHCADPDGAVADLTRLLADVSAITGARPRSLSVISHNLAVWRRQSGDLEGAADLLREVLAHRLEMFGPEHRDTLMTRHALAALHGELGDPAGAVHELVSVLADISTVLGPGHQHALDVRHDLGLLRGRLGDPAGAAAELRDVHLARARLLGPAHPATVTSHEAYLHWSTEAAGSGVEKPTNQRHRVRK